PPPARLGRPGRPGGRRGAGPARCRVDAAGTGRRRCGRRGADPMNLANYVALSAVLFTIGACTVVVRRNAIFVFLGIEMMLTSANLALVTFARMHGDLTGQVVAFFVMVVAAAEVVNGLAIIVAIYRTRRSASVDDVN